VAERHEGVILGAGRARADVAFEHGLLRTATASAPVVDDQVVGDGEDPGAESTLGPLEAADAAEHAQEHVVRRAVWVLDAGAAQVRGDRASEPLEDPLEGPGLLRPGCGEDRVEGLAETVSRHRYARSCAEMPSSRSMDGGALRIPVHALAISTISAESKWACWLSGDSHFSMTTNRPGVATDAHRSMLRQPWWPRL